MSIEFENHPVDWDNPGVEPSDVLKQEGFQAGYKPPAKIFNYLQHNTSECIDEIQTKISGLDSEVIKGIRGNGTLINPDSSNIINLTPNNLGAVPISRKINGNALSSDVTLSATDVNAVPTTRTVNGKALANNISLTASDVGASTSTLYSTTIGTSWSGSSAPYTQTVNINGILGSDSPIVDIVPSNTTSTAIAQLEAWSCISKITTNSGSITITCYEEKPDISIPIQLLVVR